MKSGFSCCNIYVSMAHSPTEYLGLVQVYGSGANSRGAFNSCWPPKGLPAPECPRSSQESLFLVFDLETSEKPPGSTVPCLSCYLKGQGPRLSFSAWRMTRGGGHRAAAACHNCWQGTDPRVYPRGAMTTLCSREAAQDGKSLMPG